jgi:alpha-ketoglutarate-dependent taurine dioxygenase
VSDLREEIERLSPTRRKLLEAMLGRGQSPAGREAGGDRIAPRPAGLNRAPLSFAQQRLWLIDQLEPGNVAYNIPVAVRLRGPLSVAALGRALNEVVRRHEALRTTFAVEGGEPVQIIHPPAELALEVDDLSALDEAERDAAVRRLSEAEALRPFDLARGPLLRARLLRLGRREHVTLLTMHHIVSDGWSAGVLLGELAALYGAFAAGRPSPLEPLPVQYADFAIWQRRYLTGEALERQLDYWTRQLRGVATLDFPTDRPRPPRPTGRGANQTILLPEALCESLRVLARREGVTLFMVLLAGFQTLMRLSTGQEDIVVGADIANRTRAETERLIGFFVNMLALRTDFSGRPTFSEVLRRVQRVTLDAYAHQDLPFEKLVAALQTGRDMSRFPVFQTVLVLQNAPAGAARLSELEMSPLSQGRHTVKFDLILFMTEEGRRLRGNLDYSTDLFDARTMALFLRRFEHVLRQAVARPEARVEEFELLTEQEKKQLQADEQEKREAARQKLQSARRRRVNLDEVNPVKTSFFGEVPGAPFVVEPAARDCHLPKWAANHRELVEARMLEHGAVLFRGFDVPTVEGFEQVASAVCPELFGEYGDLPRASAGGKVYGSTPYPADQPILYHNESSHLHRWPMKIFFYCAEAAREGGATPIADCRQVYRLLDPQLRERFSEKGLAYVRNYTTSLDVSWQDFFHTEDRSEVERQCRAAGVEFEWKPGGELRTRRVSRAVARHPRTGEEVFFNQLQLHHASCLGARAYESLRELFREEDYPRHVTYGDGTPLEDSVVAEVRDVYERAAVRFAWQAGDVLMLDNMLVAHARDPFVGPRRIVVAMGDMITDTEVSGAAARA